MATTRLTWVLAFALSLLVSSPVFAGAKPSKEELEKRRREALEQATHGVVRLRDQEKKPARTERARPPRTLRPTVGQELKTMAVTFAGAEPRCKVQ